MWTPECEEAFLKIKEQLGNPPMLAKPEDGETLILYLAVSEYSVSAVWVKEEASHQWPIYYVSKRLLDAETRYTNMEKLVYALILAARKLRPYFQAHRIEVRTAYPLRHILHKLESSGRMLKWAVELGQFNLEYCPRTAIKGQALADFIIKFDAEVNGKAIVLAEPSSQGSSQDEKRQELPHPWWILHIDGAVNNNGSGAGIVLITPEGHRLMSAIYFTFYATNNDAEYEALINGLKLALEVNGGFQARGPRTELYMRCAQRLLKKISNARLESIPREENSNADALAKMGSQMDGVQLGQIPLGIQEIPSIPEVKLEEKKGDWPEEMPMVIWSYNTTPRSATGETPFLLTYEYEAIVPMEVGVGSLRRDVFVEEDAEVNQRLHLDLLDEARTNSQLKLAAYQQRIARYFNKKVISVPFKVGDLVLRKVMPNTKIAQHGVLGANWEGPYKVEAILWKGTYRLEDLDGKLIPRA
ncbi:uncharacterized protein LOC141674045 [Apium graveolens]|uniref:uncharacterized protein LOC141674045 n=1 Tax=Apium graveolens TaxID=4045 RepID=UPI003D7B5F12